MKLKRKTKERIRGSITVLMVIILLPMMTLSAVIVDSGRINMARSMVSSAGDLATNTALANYDTILKDVYGLFAMSQEKTDKELSDDLREYFSKTLVSYGVVNEAEAGEYVDDLIGDFRQLIADTKDGKAGNFLDMNVVDFTATKVDNSSLANSDILRSQIVEYMKYRAPINFGLSFLDSIKSFKNVQSQTTVVQKQVEAQESTQDVTSACKTAIDSIRAHDNLVESIQTGNKAVIGKANKSDGQTVGIGEYHTQVDRYRTGWGSDNYKRASRLNLVFLLKSPSVNSLYLKNLDITKSQWFVKLDYTGLNYDSSINVSLSLAGDTASAKTQVQNQINKLKNANGIELKTSKAYTATKYLDHSLMSGSKFTDETKAINTFVEFEKFLKDDSSLKYSDVKTTLEGIHTLGKYYDNYNQYITAEINAAKSARDTANSKASTAQTNANTYLGYVSSNVNSINTLNKNYSTSYDFLDGVKNSDKENLKTVISDILAQNNVTPPTGANVDSFVNSNYKEKSSDTDNKYLKVFKEIAKSSLKNNDEYKKICSAATSYLSDLENNKTTKSFSDYMKSKAGNSSLNNDLYKLLDLLYQNNGYVVKMQNNINSYKDACNNYNKNVEEARKAQRTYDSKDNEKKGVYNSYKACIGLYCDFCVNYQNDLVYYGQYISTAKSVITSIVKETSRQFTEIENNIKSIIDQLTTIETNLANARTAIVEYNKKLNSWQEANNTYVSETSGDSFSQQNNADILASKSQYDVNSLDTLKAYVTSIKQEYQDFYNILIDTTHYKYGSKKIKDIKDADTTKSAVPANIKDSLPAVVTASDADGKFDSLYPGYTTPAIVLEKEQTSYYLLNPVLPIQFLRYLNETYPDPETETTESTDVKVGSEIITVGGEGGFDYDSTKEDLKKNSGKEVSDETDANKFGYTYKDKTVSKENLPSKDAGSKSAPKTNTFNVGSKDDGDIDASTGFEEQSSSLGSILSGIKDIASNTLENTYVLSYIFNNFSYNTLVQDEVLAIEKNEVDNKSPISAMSAANGLFTAGNTTFDKIKDNTLTLSNYKKNANNNKFYGAEIEYLLYGNAKAATNVKYTKASIYAIRFAFNCIYAFTDSTIRNTTMSVGLAVQAATMGIVPYQVVQIVLQLAMAAAESAVDLNMMNCGLKVAVVKNSKTWSLSLTNAVKSAGQMLADSASAVAGTAISKISSGLQGIVDAGADQLNSSITDLSTNLEDATRGKLEEIVDSAFIYVQGEIENALNQLQFIPEDEDITTAINNTFAGLENTIVTGLTNKFGGNPLGDAILPHITGEISGLVADVKGEVTAKTNGLGKDAIRDAIVSSMTDIKLEMLKHSNDAINKVTDNISSIVTNTTKDIANQLDGYITKTSGEISEEVSETIKKEVSEATNNFIGEYLDDGADAISGNASGATGSSVASMIRFGYKDYLMLFVFISLCASPDENPTIARIADMVEENIKHSCGGEKATGIQDKNGNTVKHKKGADFKMTNAKTYVSIHSNVKLDMLFMNMEFFTNLFKDETETENNETDVSGEFTPAANIEYNGISGY